MKRIHPGTHRSPVRADGKLGDVAPENEGMPACCAPAATTLGMPSFAPTSPRFDFPVPDRSPEVITKGMVTIPGGSFLMGGDHPDAFPADGEGPVRPVSVDEFRIDAKAVTHSSAPS